MNDLLLWAIHRAASSIVSAAQRSHRLREWPVTMGTVEGHRLHDYGRNGSVAEVSYSYSVMGEFYSGFREKRVVREKAAEAFFATHPKGATVMVHYDPKHPEHSAMEDSHPHGR